ncbi:MAG: molecular chaperone TorD family protein [Armatimonadota bacterium]|nr:molecular chaperone TorD family protein [Armatimonadota bacterium]MDR7440100.1 molecular chaperone TorD family protein [Armatimonadota bacterium]MDR7563588.1 molecular chaperone TorD family protein [Armatimonadota bacterium]MDR7567802.1 molecular chaperone TorD family protein [Armatimonadota bacterium]MDR7602200.1 molecular chaperone TorD family protein [Armatimonadota bacterium]
MTRLARLRQAVYRFLSAVFLYPTEKRFRGLVTSARVLRRERGFAGFAYYSPWESLLRLLAEEPPELFALQEEYVRLFGIEWRGPRCPPYASWYLDPDALGIRIRGELVREYASAGLVPAPEGSEPPDHLSVELEFMACLCGREAEAWQRAWTKEAVELLRREWGFLERYLNPWIPDFARRLREEEVAAVYRAGAAACEAFVLHEGDLVRTCLDFLCEVHP